MCGIGVVVVLCLDRTLVPCLWAAIADKRRLFDPLAVFPLKITADVVAAMTGPASGVTDEELVAGVCLSAGKSVDAEVVRIVETSAVPGIDGAVFPDFSGDSGRILAEVFCNVPEGLSFIQAFFDVRSVFKRKVFVISRYYI